MSSINPLQYCINTINYVFSIRSDAVRLILSHALLSCNGCCQEVELFVKIDFIL